MSTYIIGACRRCRTPRIIRLGQKTFKCPKCGRVNRIEARIHVVDRPLSRFEAERMLKALKALG